MINNPTIPIIQSTTLVGAQADFVLTPGCTLLRCNNATSLTLTGFAAGYDGQRLVVISIGAAFVEFAHQNVGSAAANRFINAVTAGTTMLAAGSGWAEFEYDLTTARWRLIHHEQGAWITRTFLAANYTAQAGTWVVGAARDAFWVRGRTLFYSFSPSGTTNNGANTSGRILIPNAYLPVAVETCPMYITNNGSGVAEIGAWVTAAGSSTLTVARVASAAIAAGTYAVIGQAVMELT